MILRLVLANLLKVVLELLATKEIISNLGWNVFDLVQYLDVANFQFQPPTSIHANKNVGITTWQLENAKLLLVATLDLKEIILHLKMNASVFAQVTSKF